MGRVVVSVFSAGALGRRTLGAAGVLVECPRSGTRKGVRNLFLNKPAVVS